MVLWLPLTLTPEKAGMPFATDTVHVVGASPPRRMTFAASTNPLYPCVSEDLLLISIPNSIFLVKFIQDGKFKHNSLSLSHLCARLGTITVRTGLLFLSPTWATKQTAWATSNRAASNLWSAWLLGHGPYCGMDAVSNLCFPSFFRGDTSYAHEAVCLFFVFPTPILTCTPCFLSLQTKGTTSFGKRHSKSHTLCIRCGRSSWHIQKKICSSCGYGGTKKMRSFHHQAKAHRRRTEGTGRMVYKKNLPRRAKNGFREGTKAKKQN